jgi:anhydro-N-acetylmuramic acid kinase
MSGTSLDGLDIAACKFWKENELWKYEIIKAITVTYNDNQIQTLKNAFFLAGAELIELHHQFGNVIGSYVGDFCKLHQIKPDFIASHGHTIFHQPSKGFTFQLGHGANIAAKSGFNTICDFRTSDVAYGGQGAPLVPIGDELLFGDYHYCLNLGGISNISFHKNSKREAFDIGICNMALNDLAQQGNLKFDEDGLMARSGKLEIDLLKSLKEIAAKNHLTSQSLGYEWYLANLKPILSAKIYSIQNKLRTFCEFIAIQIAASLDNSGNVLVTGGGAKNKFLMECIKTHTTSKLIVPDNQTIDYKEALIFAFLGLLRVNTHNNALKAVTKASKDSIGGCIYLA